MKIIKFVPLARLIAVLIIGACFMPYTLAEEIQGKAPDFTLKSQNGDNIKLSELRGKVILINFWASWCGPCRQEMPELDQLYQHYRSLGFTILGVNVEENSDAAKSLLKDVRVTFPILFDNTNKVSDLYKVQGMPSTIIVDRDGNKRYRYIGYQHGYEQEYQKQIRNLIRE
jgi:peroxiredoxin